MPLQKSPKLPGVAVKDWTTARSSDHFVQYYQEDEALIAGLAGYLAVGLSLGEQCIVIATEPHHKNLGWMIEAYGIDFNKPQANGQYLALDASETLAGFMVNGMPDRSRFFESVGGLIQSKHQTGQPIRAFGEMVALLWQAGNSAGAIELEKLWNELGAQYQFRLFCAYPNYLLDPDSVPLVSHQHGFSFS